MAELYKCEYCGKYISEDDGVTEITGLWVCANDSCIIVNGNNDAICRKYKDVLNWFKSIIDQDGFVPTLSELWEYYPKRSLNSTDFGSFKILYDNFQEATR